MYSLQIAFRKLTTLKPTAIIVPLRCRAPLLLPPTVKSRVPRSLTIEATCVIAGFTAVTLLMTYPLVAHLGDSLPSDLGDPLLNTWILAWDADRLRHGLQGFWDAPVFYPYARTLTYSEHFFGIAVLTAPVQWLFDNPVLTYNVAFLFSYVLAGVGMYLLAYWVTGCRLAAVTSGLAFAFCPFRIAQVSHLHVLLYGWMPIGLVALHRYFANGSRRALLGFTISFVMLALSSGYYLYFFALPVAVVTIYQLVRYRHRWKQLTAELAVAAVLIGAVLAPIAVVYYQTRWEQGLVRSRDVTALYSADVVSYVQIPAALKAWQGVLQEGRPEADLFPGLIVLALALIAVSARGTVAPEPRPGNDLSTRQVVGLYTGIGIAALCLSLGPAPSWSATQALLSSGPYDWLLAIVPGLDGLRVPARLASVVYLALAVLAAIGLKAFTVWFSRPVVTMLALVCVGGILVEGYRGPLPLARFVPEEDIDNRTAYEWLRHAPPGPMLELPLVTSERYELTLSYQFHTLQHGHPIVNGYSGYDSRLNAFLASGGSPLFDLDYMRSTLRALRSLGIRYIVVHANEYDDAAFGRSTLAAVRRHAEQVRQTQVFGSTTVFELEAWNGPVARQPEEARLVPADVFRATASRGQDRLPLAFDGDPATRWLSGRRQIGDEWIQIRFRSPRDVAKVRLDMARRSLGDYPRVLLIESSEDGETFRPLYHQNPLRQLFTGLVENIDGPPIDIVLPPNRTLSLRLQQTGHTRTFYWSIHELQLWER